MFWLSFTADPDNARFLTQDTYRGEADQPDTLHLYAYCANNPINYVDPSGHYYIFLAFPNPAVWVVVFVAVATYGIIYYAEHKKMQENHLGINTQNPEQDVGQKRRNKKVLEIKSK